MTEKAGASSFPSTGRSLVDEDEIVVLSVGVDIGSSTSHLVFSRIVLERLDSRYVVSTREAFYQSDILLTPYSAGEEIDAGALGAFIARQYENAGVDPDEIDTGALILTGVAVRRRNARAIGELFARQAGKMVAVSAGDNLETVMAAHGSGAAARSIRDKATVMNVDVGGGTSKIAVCVDGRVVRSHGARCRRPPGLSRCRTAASCASRRPRGASPPRPASRWTWAHGWNPTRRGRLRARMAERLFEAMCGARAQSRRRRPAAARSARLPPADRPGHVFRRRRRIHLRPRGDRVRRSRRAPCARDSGTRGGLGPDARTARTKASARPSSARRNTPRR